MVDKMTKYSFILPSGETEGFLENLQTLGVVDVTRSARPVDEKSADLLQTMEEQKRAIRTVEKYDISKDPDFRHISEEAQKLALPADIVTATTALKTRMEELNGKYSSVRKQLKAREPWGVFDKEALDGIEAKGFVIRYYCVSAKTFDPNWEERYPLQVITSSKGKIWFVTVTEAGAEYDFPVAECERPEGSIEDSKRELAALEKQLEQCKIEQYALKRGLTELESAYKANACEFERYVAQAATESAADNRIGIITGFAPAEIEEQLCISLDALDVLYIKEEAVEEDNPPIKLKNNRFVRMFESITGMYGMPGYSETDPTPVVSIFFMLFFAMCMGDAGYGIVLILFGIAMNKNWISIGMFKGLGSLIATLGAATLVVGTILGTAFGINLYEASWVPEAIKKCMIVGEIAGYPAQMVLALGIGVFHICLAMTIKAIGYTKRFGFKENISTWGWLLLILGGIAIAAFAFLGVMDSAVTKWAVIILGIISALGIYVFNTPGRNPLINIGAGLWDTYNMVTGILGDVLSYIRLYALGLAGGMLGTAFNDLALMVRGDGGLGWVFFISILLLGHVINILMSCLGAFVHPLRLNFVEYFKNAGFDGKGRRYTPLTKDIKEE